MAIPDRQIASLRRAVDELRDDADSSRKMTDLYKDPIRLARKTFKEQGLEIDGSLALTPEVAFTMPSPVGHRYGLFLERGSTDEGIDRYLVQASVPGLGNVTMFTMTGWDVKRGIDPEVRDWRGRPATEASLGLASAIIRHINDTLTPQ